MSSFFKKKSILYDGSNTFLAMRSEELLLGLIEITIKKAIGPDLTKDRTKNMRKIWFTLLKSTIIT